MEFEFRDIIHPVHIYSHILKMRLNVLSERIAVFIGRNKMWIQQKQFNKGVQMNESIE